MLHPIFQDVRMNGIMAELLAWYAPDMQYCAAGSHLASSREVLSARVTSRCAHLLQSPVQASVIVQHARLTCA